MLDAHLIAKTRPQVRPENVVLFGDFRVSVLADRLFRIEKDEKREFCDEATEAVWFRDMPPVAFTVTETEGGTDIRTERVTLALRENFEESYVLIDGEKRPLDNEGNLRGTYSTLDRCNGDDFMDKDGLEDTGKAIMSGFTPFYDQNTQRNWFLPIALVMRNEREIVDGTEEILSEFEDNEICKAVLSCKAINGAQRRCVNLEDLDAKTQKAVKLGIMSEAQAIKNAGGQVYGDVIQELRFDEIVKPSEATVYTLENCLEKPHKEEEKVDIFEDTDDDDI